MCIRDRLLGGLFLIWKASKEIHESIEGEEEGLKTRAISESCDRFVVTASLGFDLVFPRLIECVLLFVHPCRVRVRGYGRLGAQFLDHRQVN